MDSSTLTHVAAILVGVLVTLVLVGGFSKKTTTTTTEQTSRSAVPESSAAGDKKKKKKKKKTKGGGGTSTTTVEETAKPAPAPAPAPKEEPPKEAAAEPATTTNNKKKKKKKKATETKAPAPASNGKENVVSINSSNNNTQANSNNDAELMAALKAIDDAENRPPPPKPVEEEWTTTTTKKKKTRSQKPKPAAAANTAHANAPTSTTNTESVSVDAKKIGIIIGPKGATMKAIEEASGCKLDINAPSKDEPTTKQQQQVRSSKQPQMAIVVVSGDTKDAIQKAKKAIKELATKGYATLLQADNFGEYSISVHPRFLSEIVGPSGRTIQALQQTLDVNITIPSTDWKPNLPQVGKVQMAKVGIAGSKDNARTCKQVIQALMKYHHHEITHPGLIHEEMYVPSEFFHCVIGPRGSEIKHIRGNYKVDVYMPNAESSTDNVIVVGKQANVDKAITYIQLLMDRDTEQREKRYNDEFY